MQFTTSLFALAALVSAATAQTTYGFDTITSITEGQEIAAGADFVITWETTKTTNGTVTLSLMQGATTGTLQIGDVIAAKVANTDGKYTWKTPSKVDYATYGIQIVYDQSPSTFQWSHGFKLKAASTTQKGNDVTSSTSSTVTGSTTTSAKPTSSTKASSAKTTSTQNTTAVSTSTSTSAYSTITTSTSAASNVTVTTSTGSSNSSTTIVTPTLSTTTTGAGSSATSTAPNPIKSSGAGAQAVTGGFAVLGGLLMAFAL